MANYKEGAVTGTNWTRSCRVVIDNTFGQIPTILFSEENVFAFGDEYIHRAKTHPDETLVENFSDVGKTFDLVHPETDQVLGSASYMEFYVTLYSLYMHLAKERDARVIAAAEAAAVTLAAQQAAAADLAASEQAQADADAVAAAQAAAQAEAEEPVAPTPPEEEAPV